MLCDPDEEYSSDEDEDYVPSGEASEGESEDHDGDEEEVEGQKTSKVKKKSKTKHEKAQELKRKRGIQLPEDDIPAEPSQENDDQDMKSVFKMEEIKAAEIKKEEKEKQKADDLWSSFMKDVGAKPKPKPLPSSAGSVSVAGTVSNKACSDSSKESKRTEDATPPTKKTVTVTKIFEFAGEEVKVTEEVAAGSKEAQMLLDPKPASAKTTVGANSASKMPPFGAKRPAGGLGNVLGLINKKAKISVLEKSRIDWNSFKTTEGIADDLKIHNKGKDGYVEKQKFLAQADQRQYEKERDMRMGQAKR
ncbi:craniofacial development protein 1-like [Asterias rubens]|uniref:craniofacial development protein 1-like n=1 Tax=Asterias rubens TaxID=7604 RepID=UPI001455296C|nr:craniofacial development protein 1-like [Asterias rubens]